MEISETETKEQKFRAQNELYAPQILDVKVAPLFSLPPDLLQRYETKEEEPIKSEMKIQQLYETFHTAKRLRKEEFRRYDLANR